MSIPTPLASRPRLSRILWRPLFVLALAVLSACSQRDNQIADFVTLEDQGIGSGFVVNGLYPTEGSASDRWRWGTGAASVLYFYMDAPGTVTVAGAFENPFPGQAVAFALNGQPLAALKDLPKNEDKAHPIVFTMEGTANQGRNLLEVSYAEWGGKESTRAVEARDFAVKFRKFSIVKK